MRAMMMRMMMAVLFLTAMPAWAGEKERAVALELVKMVVPQETYDQMMSQMVSAMSEQFRNAGQKLPPDFDKKIQAAVNDVLSYKDVLEWTADIYASRFTVEELKDIEKFYRTPVGKKVMKLLPELSGEIGKKIATVIPERMPAALKKQGLMPDDEAAPEPEPTPAPGKVKKK
jgi:hypothetical protein